MARSRAAGLLALTFLLIGAAPAGAIAPSCRHHGARVVASNADAMITALYVDSGEYKHVVGCLRHSPTKGFHFDVDDYEVSESVSGRPLLVGHFGLALIETHDLNGGGVGYALTERDLATGAETNVTENFGFANDVEDRVVRRDGAFAWIQNRAGKGWEVVTCPRRVCIGRPLQGPSPIVVDKGEDIDPFSLERRGKRITWTDGGKRRSAPL